MKTCRNHKHQICPSCNFGPEGYRPKYVTDAGKRVCDQMNAYLTFHRPWEIRNKCMAFKLSDGSTDGALYDSREDAIKHQAHPQLCAYIFFRSCLGGAKPLDCQIFLDTYRCAYDAGLSMHEPKAPQLILPVSAYDRMRRNGIN